MKDLNEIGPNGMHALLRRMESRNGPYAERYFIDRLTITGDLYLIPSTCGQDWHDFDIAVEQGAEAWPVPAWAVPVDEMSHIEFEAAMEVV